MTQQAIVKGQSCVPSTLLSPSVLAAFAESLLHNDSGYLDIHSALALLHAALFPPNAAVLQMNNWGEGCDSSKNRQQGLNDLTPLQQLRAEYLYCMLRMSFFTQTAVKNDKTPYEELDKILNNLLIKVKAHENIEDEHMKFLPFQVIEWIAMNACQMGKVKFALSQLNCALAQLEQMRAWIVYVRLALTKLYILENDAPLSAISYIDTLLTVFKNNNLLLYTIYFLIVKAQLYLAQQRIDASGESLEAARVLLAPQTDSSFALHKIYYSFIQIFYDCVAGNMKSAMAATSEMLKQDFVNVSQHDILPGMKWMNGEQIMIFMQYLVGLSNMSEQVQFSSDIFEKCVSRIDEVITGLPNSIVPVASSSLQTILDAQMAKQKQWFERLKFIIEMHLVDCWIVTSKPVEAGHKLDELLKTANANGTLTVYRELFLIKKAALHQSAMQYKEAEQIYAQVVNKSKNEVMTTFAKYSLGLMKICSKNVSMSEKSRIYVSLKSDSKSSSLPIYSTFLSVIEGLLQLEHQEIFKAKSAFLVALKTANGALSSAQLKITCLIFLGHIFGVHDSDFENAEKLMSSSMILASKIKANYPLLAAGQFMQKLYVEKGKNEQVEAQKKANRLTAKKIKMNVEAMQKN